MPTDAKQIEPALSAEEWAKALHPQVERGFPEEPDDASDIAELLSRRAEAACAFEEYPKAIAIANAALPDDSPYKITREDCRTLHAFRCYVQDFADMTMGVGVAADDVHKFDALAAKLAALLPPHE